MITVALIGGDGSGKSSISQMLIEGFDLPMKYIYMGANIESSNYALPWSKLILQLKLLLIRRRARKKGVENPTFVTTHHIEHRQQKTSALRVFLRSAYRFSEYAYRHAVAWWLKRRGFNIIFDRHYLFDVAPDDRYPCETTAESVKRVNYWLLKRVFSQPDLIIFLDASPEVMIKRKQEVTVEYLEKFRDFILHVGKSLEHFEPVDANQPLDQVFADVSALIHEYHERRK